MKLSQTATVIILCMSVSTLSAQVAQAFFHAAGGSVSRSDGSWSASNDRGGTASGGDGSWSASNDRGGTASGGDGSWSASNDRGGTASGGDGSWTATSAYGTTAYGNHNYYGGSYATYHPPTVVNSYYGNGCYNCGGWTAAGAALGAAAGAAITSTSNANAYEAGVAAASTYAMGAIYSSLPTGCQATSTPAGTFYQCGTTWFRPSYGANGVYYRVVPPQ